MHRVNFRRHQLETKFSEFVKANTPTKTGKQKGLLSINWLNRYRHLVPASLTLQIPSVVIAIFDLTAEDFPAVGTGTAKGSGGWQMSERAIHDKYKDLL